jgi:hypothetical protein
MSAPDILMEIKDDLGICGVSDHDAWLQRRIANVWSRMEHYTSRSLAAPPVTFIDDWTRIALTNPQQPLPPALYMQPRSTVFLRHFPVSAIDAIDLSGTLGDPVQVRFDPSTGKLFSLNGQAWGEDVSGQMHGVRITYRAGWSTIPGDLYEIVLGAVQTAWASRSASAVSGGLQGTVTGITVADVGSLEIGAGNAFVNATMKGIGTTDPILGPYINTLSLYVDHRSLIGHALVPVTEPVPP